MPTLATREELKAAIAPLATRDEMREAIRVAVEPLATREEMREAIRLAIEPLATREEMHQAIRLSALATREELRATAEGNRRHTTVLFESLRDDIRLLAENLAVLMNRR